MFYLLLVILIIACILLVFIILAQNPKGGGLSSMGSGASNLLGARQAADFLEKMTWYFGIGIIVAVVGTYFLGGGSTTATAEGEKGPAKTFKVRENNGYMPSGINTKTPTTQPAPGQTAPQPEPAK